jgi:DNA-binding MarR family transcriptional regulator
MTKDDPRLSAIVESLRGVIGKLKRQMRAQSHAEDLSWSQISMLSRLERDGTSTVAVLARAEGVRPQSMGATIRDLEAAGYVTGKSDPQDGRQTLWQVTPKTRVIVQTMRAARQDWMLAAFQKHFSRAEQDDIARAVKLLERIAE